MKNSTQTFLVVALIYLTSIYVTMTVLGYENNITVLQDKIELLEDKSESDDLIIQKLKYDLDSIQKRFEIFDSEPGHDFMNVLNAIIQVESGGNPNAHAKGEDAVGILQIRKCMVDDINRILKSKTYSYEDRWCERKSIEMFDIFCEHYSLDTAEEMARCWNGGPRGCSKPSTEYYWNKVESELEIYASS